MKGSFCTPDAGLRFAERLLVDTDCQAMGMVERGYAALAQPGGTVSTALTGLMIIAVAFFGYRLLLGRGIVLSDAVSLTVKLGVVLLLATSWASWQALAYDGLARAPTQIAGDMLVAIDSPPPIETLDNTLDGLTQAAVGYRSRAGIASPLVGGPAAAAAVLNLSAIILTLSTVGILVASKVVLAILLAIAPAMAGLILFNGTRGMAQGWLAAMAVAAILPAFAILIAAIQFAILTPILARLLAEQGSGVFENASVMPIGLVSVVFVIAFLFAIRAASQIGTGLLVARRAREAVPTPTVMIDRDTRFSDRGAVAAPASVMAVSRALETIARRDSAPAATRSRAIAGASASRTARDGTPGRPAAAAESFAGRTEFRPPARRHGVRRSRAAARRDS
ncbi:type IV secretion system protein [Sphingomonas sabuli]|uniref:Type IV secretion system protein n=1 Tax=Sphingomonas sabuli TaxID=2764186 RepID=A0A7G9KZC2_9SPHN|nr:type IV secretion system protein [Sphingomonas sabuli]QNM81721.1 type IV secretion system protein [Sphingomonas sabuli]